MRRVVPLRPSETNLLVTYDNGTYEHDEADTDTGLCKSTSAASVSSSSFIWKGSLPSNSRRHGRRSSANFSVTFREDKSSPLKSLWKSPSSVYPEFTEVASPSPRSSFWTSCSFRDDGDSTSFNFSDGTHRRATSSLSSSSSSSIGSASQRAIPSAKDSQDSLDMASSSSKDIPPHINAESNPSSKDSSLQSTDASIFKPPLKPLQISIPDPSGHSDTPVYAIPRKVQEDMHSCTDVSTNRRLSHRSASSPKVSERSGESSNQSRSCFPRSMVESSSYRRASTKSLQQRKAMTVCSCSTPFKYLTKCLKTEKSSKALEKESRDLRQPSLPAKFSTLMNQLYSPQCPSQGKSASPKMRPLQNVECNKKLMFTGKDVEAGTPQSFFQGGVHSHANCDACPTLSENWQPPMRCQPFGSDTINDYVRHIHEVGQLPSLGKAPKSASFHYDSDSSFSKGSKRRPLSMHVDRDSSPNIFAAGKKKSQNLALSRLEISKLRQEKRFLTRELAAEIKARLSEQKSAESAVKHMEAEMEERLISLEKDHACAQACLEKEIDRRKKEWSAKLDKIRKEERRLRDRVTEMALERVELQKAIALYKGREASLQTQVKDHELSAQAWMWRHRRSDEEVVQLRQSFTNVCNKLDDKEHELDLVLQRSKVLESENAGLWREFSRLRRSYADQETTFEELWQRLVDIANGPSDGKLESLRRLHGELKVFGVREQALRYEIGVLQLELLYSKQKNSPASEDGKFLCEGNMMCFTKEHPNLSKRQTGKHKESSVDVLDDLAKKLELAKQHTRQVEHQLEVKEEEVELLQSTLQEREHVVKDLQDQLTWGKAQRDGLRMQVQQMSHEALRLTMELTELRKVVEKLDDELMLKEGQISILREACSDSEF